MSRRVERGGGVMICLLSLLSILDKRKVTKNTASFKKAQFPKEG